MENSREVTDIREYRLKRQRAGSARWILVLVFLIACMFAGYFFARSDFFAVKQIDVIGNEHVDADRLRDLSGFKVGENMFSVTVSDAEQWLLIEPGVQECEVTRKPPHRVIITVKEREPLAVMVVGSSLIEIDAAGRVLDRYPTANYGSLPLISGVDLTGQGVVPGGVIDAKGVDSALEILEALPPDAADVGEINVSDPQSICLYTVSGVQIKLGDSSGFEEKYLVYSNILADHKANGGKMIEYIDVSIPEDPAIKYLDI
ncbi:MAG: FtsQ-type POTRA domain-containing protein [Firmicutes bacterium]|nr:FtsQ-type POTRA domain-containing protein [Bacillota bacterium]MBQ6606844.1 FtsQ-type POTRA domain-containing protein [Bacillota bacterium]